MNRFKPALALLAAAVIGSLPVHAQAKGDPAKGQTLAGACAAFHGVDGNSVVPVNPNLAGQHGDYIAKQLAEFKAGTRANPIMAGMAAALTPEAMADLGAHFRRQFAGMVRVDADEQRMELLQHRAQLECDPLRQKNRNARTDAQKLDVRNRPQAREQGAVGGVIH